MNPQQNKLFLQVQKGIHCCHECPLCPNPDSVHITFRGSPEAEVWIVAEAPGKIEEIERKPFVGPAGKILDKMIEGLGFDEDDFYITNVVKGRPKAQEGSGRENLPPTTEMIKQCRHHFEAELKILKPKIVCLMGGSAIKAFYNKYKIKVSDYVGRAEKISGLYGYDMIAYHMYHPSYLLHSKKKGEEEYQKVRTELWEQAKGLRRLISTSLK